MCPSNGAVRLLRAFNKIGYLTSDVGIYGALEPAISNTTPTVVGIAAETTEAGQHLYTRVAACRVVAADS